MGKRSRRVIEVRRFLGMCPTTVLAALPGADEHPERAAAYLSLDRQAWGIT